MDLHQVIDISKTNNPYPCSSVHVGFVRKKKTIHRLRMIKQAHMSQVLYKMRMLHDPGGRKQLLHGDMKPMFFSKQESGESFRDNVDTSVNTPKHRIKSVQPHVVYKAGIKSTYVDGWSRDSEQESRLHRMLPELEEGSRMEVQLAPLLKERDLMQLQVHQQVLQDQQYTRNNDDKAREDRLFLVGGWDYFFSVWHRWRNIDYYHFKLLTQESLQPMEKYTVGGDHYIFIRGWHIKLFHTKTLIEVGGTRGENLHQLALVLHSYEKQILGDFSQSYLLVAVTPWITKMQRGIAIYHVWHRWKARYLQIFEYKFDAAGSKPNCALATLL